MAVAHGIFFRIMFFRIGKSGCLSLRDQRVNHDEVLLNCARIGFNP
jgi:hypothetical protein